MKFTIQVDALSAEAPRRRNAAFRILHNHRQKRIIKNTASVFDSAPEEECSQQIPLSPMMTLHNEIGTILAYSEDELMPGLIDVEVSSSSWEWNKILDEESPFFKNSQEPQSQPFTGYQEPARDEQPPACKRSSIFLPKFKEFVWSNPDTDCSVSQHSIY